MRKELKKLDGLRDLFIAKFVREGSKSSYKGAQLPTILLKDVLRVSDKKLMCDHLWFNKTKAFAALELKEGLEIQFAARVKQYSKGYLGRRDDLKKEIRQDFKLSHPTQVSAVGSLHRKNNNDESKLIIRKAKRDA
jgi:hypothetical protein